jgi:hypothetical protein
MTLLFVSAFERLCDAVSLSKTRYPKLSYCANYAIWQAYHDYVLCNDNWKVTSR